MKQSAKLVALSVVITLAMIAVVVFCNWLGALSLGFFTETLGLQENIVHALGITSIVIQAIVSILSCGKNKALTASVMAIVCMCVTASIFSVAFAALCLPWVLGVFTIPSSMKTLQKNVNALN